MASDQVIRIRGELERVVSRVVVAIVLHTTANLVAAPAEGGTPVDTGWASANWIPEIGSSRDAPVGDRPAAGTAASRTAQEAGLAAVLAYRYTSRAPAIVYITNAVPYILPLNDGHSPQAAAGFIQRAIAKAVTNDLTGFRA